MVGIEIKKVKECLYKLVSSSLRNSIEGLKHRL